MVGVWIVGALLLGLVVSRVGLPPLVGFLASGFVFAAFGMDGTPMLTELAHAGVLLLLFAVGLKLRIKTLLRYAKICGAGASIRALTSGKASLIAGLLKDSGPEEVVTQLAAAKGRGGSDFESVHLFAFGGFLKTTKWVSAVQKGRFEVNERDGDFSVQL